MEVSFCAPECLLTSEPVKDPYSTDGEINSDIKEKENGHRKAKYYMKTVLRYNNSDLTTQKLSEYFQLNLQPIPEMAPPANDCDVPTIVNHIIKFLTTNRKKVLTQKELFESFQKFPVTEVDELCSNPDFHFNLKDNGGEIPHCDHILDKPAYKRACVVLRKIQDIVLSSMTSDLVDYRGHYDRVRGCLGRLCELTSENVLIHGECIHQLEATTAFNSTTSQTLSVEAQPDVLITCSNNNYLCPGIPFKIYSPSKKEEIVIRSKSVENEKFIEIKQCSFPAKNENETTIGENQESETSVIEDQDSENKFIKKLFMVDNLPKYLLEKMKSCENQDYRITDLLVCQHLLQILGVASEYCYDKMCHKIPAKNSKAFVGFLVCDEYIFITKVQGDERSFVKYNAAFNSRIGNSKFRQTLVNPWFRTYNNSLNYSDVDSKIQVQFSPVVLDVSVHTHRVALLRFIQYYMYNWQ